MPTLDLTLFGEVGVRLNGQPVRFTRRSSLALVVYLACAGRVQSRTTLATLIAGDSNETQASMALSNALRDVRTVFGGFLQIDTRTVTLDSTVEVTSDVSVFEAAAQDGLHHRSIALLREAVRFYRGEFAAGLVLKGAPEFDDWVQVRRVALRERYLDVLASLALVEEECTDRNGAITTLRCLIAEEPWREEAHRTLMRLLVADNQRTAALLQFEQCREALWRELGVEPQPETYALYEAIQTGPITPPHNLPARSTSFVDRPVERSLLAAQLRYPGSRLISIVGIGGTGKTSLALALATECIQPGLPDELAFPDGVFFITCGEAMQIDAPATHLLALSVLRSLNLHISTRSQPKDVVLDWLSTRKVLLILDNAESEPTVAAFALAVLAAAPDVRLLITSRVRLRLEAEWVFDLAGLNVPNPGEDLWHSEAGQLFLERARAVCLRNQLGPSDYPHIVNICRLVDGLPLAIVLAASRLRVLTCAEIARQLAHDLHILESDVYDLPVRQRSLRSVIRWSYAQLTPEEAQSVQMLAVFSGEFDAEGAYAVSGCTPRMLETLIDYGLVSHNGQGHRLHPLVRQFVAKQLERTNYIAAERHASYYAGLTATLAQQAAQDSSALSALGFHLEDLQQAWNWAIAQQNCAHLVDLLPAMSQLWYSLGIFHEGVRQCEQAVNCFVGAMRHPINPRDYQVIFELLIRKAWLQIFNGYSNDAFVTIERARRYILPSDNTIFLHMQIDQLEGTQLYLHTRYQAARPILERAFAAAIDIGNRDSELKILSALARLAYRQGSIEGLQMCVAALNKRFGNARPSVDQLLIRYCEAYMMVDQGDTALAHMLLNQYTSHGHPSQHFLIRFAYYPLHITVALAEGRLTDAEVWALRTEQQAEEIGSGFMGVYATTLLGEVLAAQGLSDHADRTFVRALQQATTIGMPLRQCEALLGRARCAELRGIFARTLQFAEEAMQIAREEAYVRLIRKAAMRIGRACAGLHRYTEAVEAFAQARKADLAFGHWVQAAEAAVAEAEIWLKLGAPSTAIQQITPYLPLLLDGVLTAEEPVATLLRSAKILHTTGDPRATPLFKRASSELANRAAMLQPERREAFINRIPTHREIQSSI